MKLPRIRFFATAALLSAGSFLPSARATGSATWSVNPATNIWGQASNWTPANVPSTISDTATFGVSNVTSIMEAPGGFSTNIGAMVFSPGASAYTINFSRSFYAPGASIAAGVTNNSGVLQSFILPLSSEFRDENQYNNTLNFTNSATAGTLTHWVVGSSFSGAYRPGELIFDDTSTAATSTVVVSPGGSVIGGEDGDGYGGILDFFSSSTADHANITVMGGVAGANFGSAPYAYFWDNATAANATITTTGGTISSGYGGVLTFLGSSTAANATITNQGGAVSGGLPGQTSFHNTSTAGNATVIANGGPEGAAGGSVSFIDTATAGNATVIANDGPEGAGGTVVFAGSATGGTARMELFGNGTLNISYPIVPVINIGSVEGDGSVLLGTHNLSVGANDLSSTFSGVIQDGAAGTGGSLTKIGKGALTLTGANLYTGGTTVTGGTLAVNNTTGSGTGTGAVTVNGGTLGGSGTISGAVTVNSGAFLAPAAGTKKQAALTMQSALTFKAGSTYSYTFKARGKQMRTDKVVAKGVTIASGASFNFSGQAQGKLRTGLTLTVLSNTSGSAISGTFSNLPDGAVLSVNGNNFQANYAGGDGNDLTLTVVP